MTVGTADAMVINAILRASNRGRNGTIMTEAPENPFRPGVGLLPAHMGRRPEIEDVLSRFLRTLRSGRPGAELGFIYGPRGNGKTVLLRWLRREAARGDGSGKKIISVRIYSEEVKSPVLLTRRILLETSRLGYWMSRVTGGRLAILGLGSVQVAGTDLSRSLAEILSKKRTPVLLTLDEAHEAPPEILDALLNAVQEAGDVRPIAAVFAGTPGLEAALCNARAAFWSRGRKLRIGLLENESAQEVLARPFRDAGLETDDEAIAKLAAATDNYPYFLQLYGEAAWNVVKESGGRVFLPEHVVPTLETADRQRRVYYRNRLDEFFEAKWLPLARKVAEAFVESAESPAERHLSDAELREIVADQSDAVEARRFLTAKGYVWRDAPDSSSWTPGIPSLMDYMLEEISTP